MYKVFLMFHTWQPIGFDGKKPPWLTTREGGSCARKGCKQNAAPVAPAHVGSATLLPAQLGGKLRARHSAARAACSQVWPAPPAAEQYCRGAGSAHRPGGGLLCRRAALAPAAAPWQHLPGGGTAGLHCLPAARVRAAPGRSTASFSRLLACLLKKSAPVAAATVPLPASAAVRCTPHSCYPLRFACAVHCCPSLCNPSRRT